MQFLIKDLKKEGLWQIFICPFMVEEGLILRKCIIAWLNFLLFSQPGDITLERNVLILTLEVW